MIDWAKYEADGDYVIFDIFPLPQQQDSNPRIISVFPTVCVFPLRKQTFCLVAGPVLRSFFLLAELNTAERV